MNSELENALTHALKTVANCKTNEQAKLCGSQAVSWWVKNHLGQEWHIINVGLTLISNQLDSRGAIVTRKSLGVLQKHTLFGWNSPSTLWVYESDRYTETWVHELIEHRATGFDNRILCIERNDSESILDLGSFKFAQ